MAKTSGNLRGGKSVDAKLADVRKEKEALVKTAQDLTAEKKRKYGKMPIDAPKSEAEKELDKKTADAWAKVNSKNIEIQKLLEQKKKQS